MTTHLTPRSQQLISGFSCYSLLTLFMYTAANKLLTIKNFASTLAKSVLIGKYSVFIAWSIPLTEILIGLLLIFSATRRLGLYASSALLVLFTLYLSYMVLSGSNLPCHCGGVISSMTWQQHIWFNLAFIVLAFLGARMTRPDPEKIHV